RPRALGDLYPRGLGDGGPPGGDLGDGGAAAGDSAGPDPSGAGLDHLARPLGLGPAPADRRRPAPAVDVRESLAGAAGSRVARDPHGRSAQEPADAGGAGTDLVLSDLEP